MKAEGVKCGEGMNCDECMLELGSDGRFSVFSRFSALA